MAIRDIFRTILEALWFSDYALNEEFEILTFYLEAASSYHSRNNPFFLSKSYCNNQ